MTMPTADEMRRAYESATAGLWVSGLDVIADSMIDATVVDPDIKMLVQVETGIYALTQNDWKAAAESQGKKDADFIAFAHNHFPALIAMRVELDRESAAHEVTISQRDAAEEWADKLAYAVAPIEVIGEHSNLNNPWEQAYNLVRSDANVQALTFRIAALEAELAAANETIKLYAKSCGQLADALRGE